MECRNIPLPKGRCAPLRTTPAAAKAATDHSSGPAVDAAGPASVFPCKRPSASMTRGRASPVPGRALDRGPPGRRSSAPAFSSGREDCENASDASVAGLGDGRSLRRTSEEFPSPSRQGRWLVAPRKRLPSTDALSSALARAFAENLSPCSPLIARNRLPTLVHLSSSHLPCDRCWVREARLAASRDSAPRGARSRAPSVDFCNQLNSASTTIESKQPRRHELERF